MKLNRDQLLAPLTAAAAAVAKKSVVPITMSVLIQPRDGQVWISGTDLTLAITATSPADITASDPFVVEPSKLIGFLRTLPTTADLTITRDGAKAIVKSGKSRVTLATLPAVDYPDLQALTDPQRFALPERAMRQLLSQVSHAMASNDVRYFMIGAHLVADGDTIRMEATDSYRVAVASAILSEEAKRAECIIPRLAVLELQKLLSDSDEPVVIEVGDQIARFSFGRITLTTKLVDGRFPEVDRIIPVADAEPIVVDRETMIGALKRASYLTHERYRGVRVQVADRMLKLLAENSQAEATDDEIDVEFSGSADMALNVDYLGDATAAVAGDVVHLMLFDAPRPCALISAPNSTLTCVIAAMRI